MNKLIDRITRRIFTPYLLFNMLLWFCTPEEHFDPIFEQLEDFPDDARPIILGLWRLYPLEGICAIIDSIRHHFY